MKIEHAIETWPKGSRRIGIRTYTSDLGRYGMCREFEIDLWKFQLLVSVTTAPRAAPARQIDIN